ncbi:MAG: DUF58 domain-containing protein [Candidatus Margulisbacteria bacterium]|nr:DUF58 domain-containing protein [Candidatus Margulisiibacteriota bacterium]
MEVKELLKKVRKIEIKSRKIVNTLFLGEYHSAFKGKGIEFSEVREYQYGDDIRLIDWNVTSRMDKPFVKVNHEERELTVFLLIDLSKSLLFGTRNQIKRDLLTELAAIFAFSAITNNDKVGLLIFADKVYKYVKPAKGKKQVLKIIYDIIDFKPDEQGGSTDIAAALGYFNQIQKRQAVVILISDFLAKGYSDALKFTSRKHQLVPIWLQDLFEENIKGFPYLRFLDMESGREFIINSSSGKWVKDYSQHIENRKSQLKKMFRQARIEPMAIYTDKPYLPVLLNYFKGQV